MRIVVAGAGKIGRYLGAELAARGHDVTIIERDDRAIARLPGSTMTVVHGDACAPDVLERAEVRTADAVVAVTGDDEDNLVVSLLSKEEFGVPRVLARVNYPTNEWLFDTSWGVDVAVSPPHLLTALVEEDVISGDVVELLKLQQGEVELLEIRLDEQSSAVGRSVDELQLPEQTTLVAVLRTGRVLKVRGTLPLTTGDQVLALVAKGYGPALREVLVG